MGRFIRNHSATAIRQLRIELLEKRFVLAAALGPVIEGVLFSDRDGDGRHSDTELLGRSSIALYEDNGDGVFDGQDRLIESSSTDADGRYCFDGLQPQGYFVVVPEQTGLGVQVRRAVSELILPLQSQVLIDSFDTPQSASTTAVSSTVVSAREAIGGTRRIVVFGPAADASVAAGVLESNFDDGTVSVQWDIPDDIGGLSEQDRFGFLVRAGSESSSDIDPLSISLLGPFGPDPSSSVSLARPIPKTENGSATELLLYPFDEFQGTGSVDDAQRIFLTLGGQGSVTISEISVVVASTTTVNIAADTVGIAIEKTD